MASVLPFAVMASTLVVLMVAPQWLMAILWLEVSLLMASLVPGFALAIFGWWSYAIGARDARHALRPGADSAGPSDPLP